MVPCGLVLRSVGYRGVAARRASRSTSAAARSRTTAAGSTGSERIYVAGWIKRGPSGVIGTNKKDATETVELLLADARAGRLAAGDDGPRLDELLDEHGVDVVDYAGWRRSTPPSGARASRSGGRA